MAQKPVVERRTQTSYTGRVGRRKPTMMVRFTDKAAKALVTVGGIGTIVAVLLVVVYLFWVARGLLVRSTLEESKAWASRLDNAVALRVNEFQSLVAIVDRRGELICQRTDTFEEVLRRSLVENASPAEPVDAAKSPPVDNASYAAIYTCSTRSPGDPFTVFGRADGQVQLGTLEFVTSFPELGDQEPSLAIGPSDSGFIAYEDGILERTAAGQYRFQKVAAALEPPIATGGSSPVISVDAVEVRSGRNLVTLCEDGSVFFTKVKSKKDQLTKKVKQSIQTTQVAYENANGSLPRFVRMFGLGDAFVLAWEDGHALRFSTQQSESLELAEQFDIVPESGTTLTALEFIIGRFTLMAGDSQGRVAAWFKVNADASQPAQMRRAHLLAGNGSAVVSLAAGERTRVLAAVSANGATRVGHLTSARWLFELPPAQTPGDVPNSDQAPAMQASHTAASAESPRGPDPPLVIMNPKDNGLTVLAANTPGAKGGNSGLQHWRFDLGHPEANLASLFLPVWYEEYPEPSQVWQSSGGQNSEPKFGLFPLVFGTLKATIYCMLIGAPLALLAAIYTSEFLHPKMRAKVKPAVELMASLPSVVLGFLAAAVVAPFVRDHLPGTLMALITVPFVLLMAAYLWQMLPRSMATRWQKHRLWLVALCLPVGIALAGPAGRFVERIWFGGDVMAWLDGQQGNATGGWAFLLLPFVAVAAWWFSRELEGVLRKLSAKYNRTIMASLDLVKFLLLAGGTFGVALSIGFALSALGLDPRGTLVDTYDQRNSLVVGLMMGFAVVPIIYTIAEDALATVPQHLRSASLGAGATTWQTAKRIVIPTAMSGLFSAVMVGLGRAVGETMIVLMATGSTPIMKVNIFEGLRTLSANLAIELSEAPQGETHYLVLFLSALTLFGMTFVVNTVAEAVRQRFRKRAYEL